MTHAQSKSRWKSLVGGLLLMSVLGISLIPSPGAFALAESNGPDTGPAFEAETAPADCSVKTGFSNLLCNFETLLSYLSPSLLWRGMLETVFGFISGIVTEIFRGVAFATNSVIIGLMNMPVSPSHPEAPSAIKEGWEISRDLVNLLFLTLLVFIGLATILDLPGYAYKQSLPLFLVMVLLINFSGLLVGLMADIGNIVTNFFLQKTQEVGWTSMQFSTPADLASKGGWAIVTTHLAEIVYYFAAIFVFYALLLVFFIRTFVLWTLAIVAPFAFASYILPSTRGMIWNRWWKELIQWSLIGVPISFFMYLSGLVLARADIGSVGLSWAANMMGPFTSLFLLFAGIAIAMEFVPKGAAGAVAHAQGLGKKTALWAKRTAGDKARRTMRGAVENSPWLQAKRDRMEQLGQKGFSWGQKDRWYNPLGYVKRGAAALAGSTTRAIGKGAKAIGSGMDERVRAETEQVANKEDARGKVSLLREALEKGDKVRARAILSSLVNAGELDDATSAVAMGKGNELDWDKDGIADLFRDAVQSRDSGTQKAIARAFAGTRTIADIEKEIKDKEKERGTLSPEVFAKEMGKLTEALAKAQAAKSDTNEKGDIGTSAQLGSIMHQELEAAIKNKRFGNLTDAEKAKIQVDDQGLTKKDREESGFTSYLEKTIAGIKTADDMKQMQDGWWKGELAMEAANRFWKGSQFQAAANQFGRTFIEGLEEFKNNRGADWFFAIDEHTKKPRNPGAAQFFASTPAQALGLSPLPGAGTRAEVNKRAQEAFGQVRFSSLKPEEISKQLEQKRREREEKRKEYDSKSTNSGIESRPQKELKPAIESLDKDIKELEEALKIKRQAPDSGSQQSPSPGQGPRGRERQSPPTRQGNNRSPRGRER